MKYRIDVYDEQMMVWRPIRLAFEDKDEAIKEMDKLFFSKVKKSYRVINNEQKIASKRLFVIEKMA